LLSQLEGLLVGRGGRRNCGRYYRGSLRAYRQSRLLRGCGGGKLAAAGVGHWKAVLWGGCFAVRTDRWYCARCAGRRAQTARESSRGGFPAHFLQWRGAPLWPYATSSRAGCRIDSRPRY